VKRSRGEVGRIKWNKVLKKHQPISNGQDAHICSYRAHIRQKDGHHHWIIDPKHTKLTHNAWCRLVRVLVLKLCRTRLNSELWCTCFITKTEVLFFLVCALIVIFGREFSLSTLTFHFFIYSFFYSLFYAQVVVVVHQGNWWEEVELHLQRPGSQMF